MARDNPTFRIVVTVVTLLLALAGLTFVISGALFSTEESGSATATTGTVELDASTPVDTTIAVDNLAPGDVRDVPLTVDNTGSLALTYNISSAPTVTTLPSPNLNEVLQVRVTSESAPGDVLYEGDLVSELSEFFEEDRALAALESETLLLAVSLPEELGNEYQGLSTEATLTVIGTHMSSSPTASPTP